MRTTTRSRVSLAFTYVFMPLRADGFNGLGVEETPHRVPCRIVRRINGLAVDEAGTGAAVLLLHGFPDTGQLWKHQIPALQAVGLRTVVIDMRGFGASDKPQDVEPYRVPNHVADMVAILDELDIERARVVGHDWGAGVAWAMALMAPDRVERLVALSVGHPARFSKRSVAQREKSWYMLLFQFPEAEDILRKNDWALAREWLASHPEHDEAIERLKEPGALTAALNWYRASMHPRNELRDATFPNVTVPTLGVWSAEDNFLLEDAMKHSGEHVDAEWRYERIEGAGHWMQLDAPDHVSELLVEFLA
ncbi:MAG TPA: alpha/beta hydrolase [Solirubrobacter sp.]|nr:alpha/beta hydrolase [Solirubrobacter sp.]